MVNPIIDVLTVNQLLFLRAMLIHQSALGEVETTEYIERVKSLIAEMDEHMAHSAFYCSEV
jgi:hypothetical protein